MRKILLLFTALTFAVVGCKKKEEEEQKAEPFIQEVSFTPYFGEQAIENINTVFTMDNGWRVKISSLKFLFTELKVGNKLLAEAAYYEFPNTYNNIFLSKEVASTLGAGLSLGIGVGEANNHSDPSAWPVEHPLNILNSSDMHWSWNPGYIFYKMDMIVDSLNIPGQDNFNHIISYHIGLDNNYHTLNLENATSYVVNANKQTMRLKLDLQEFLLNSDSGINLSTESISHSTGPQAPIGNRVANRLPDFIKSY